jgi:hypothetical protein
MKRILVVLTVLLLAALSIGVMYGDHMWWKSYRFTVTENGKAVTNAKVYAKGGMAFVTLPEWKYEAYIIDLQGRTVVAALTHRFFPSRYVLFSRDAPPDGIYFGKLERDAPQFVGNTVTFRSYSEEQIVVRW